MRPASAKSRFRPRGSPIRTLLVLASLLLGLLAVPQAGFAQKNTNAEDGGAVGNAGDAASRWGLIGRWRYDCGKPPARSNVGLAYQVEGGQLVHKRDFGDGTGDTNPIRSAQIRPDGAIDIVLFFPSTKATRENVFQKVPGSSLQMRTLLSRDLATDQYFIKDGLLTQSGEPFVLLTRCGGI
ncbi:MAG TPA: hypothetical protein VMI56_18985 [Reyranella sp.]|nr:hypothetical protein [Reyranella sp.]